MSKIVFFDCSIYDRHMIERAIEDYRHLAEIELQEVEPGVRCNFKRCQYDLDLTMREFSNYCLDLTVHYERT